MDGNQRWAKINNKTKITGYNQGLKKINEITDYCLNKKIKYLTIYALSTENLKRKSVKLIYQLIEKKYISFLKELESSKQVKINIIGDKNNLPTNIKDIILKINKKNNKNYKLILNIAFNYGTENEIIYMVNKLLEKKIKKIKNNQFSLIKENMFLKGMPNPDILIRTGGYQRLSNFLLLYLSYTELFFTNTLWPDFNTSELDKILIKYNSISRKYGL